MAEEVAGAILEVVLEVVLSGVVEAVCSARTESSSTTTTTTTTTASSTSSSSSSSVSQSSGPFGYTKRVTKAGYLVKEGATGLIPPFNMLRLSIDTPGLVLAGTRVGHLWKSWKRRWFTLRGTVLTYHESCEVRCK
jgi:hypothetical protein